MTAVEQILFMLGVVIKGINIPYLTSGGCGYFAEVCYRALAGIGLQPEIVVFDNQNDVMYAIKNNDIAWNGASHVMVRCGDYYIDGNSVYASLPSRWTKYGEPVPMPYELLVEWNKPGNSRWNPMFDRNDVELIEKFFFDFLSHLPYEELSKNLQSVGAGWSELVQDSPRVLQKAS